MPRAELPRLLSPLDGKVATFDFDAYVAAGGYRAARKILGSAPAEEPLAQVERSGLLDTGDGGSSVASQWRAARAAVAVERFVVCDGAEWDPGSWVSRWLLEANPHAVLEGLLLGSYAVGARQGFICVGPDASRAFAAVERAIGEARRHGWLGRAIQGTTHAFHVELVRVPDAARGGDADALCAAIEAGAPSAGRPPGVRSADGLWGAPTCVHDVETWSRVPRAATGEPCRTRLLTLAGSVRRAGLVEVELGTPLRRIVSGIGGGVAAERTLKAVQLGGPCGAILPDALLDLPLDFTGLDRAGVVLRSGSLTVLDDRTCLVDLARHFTRALRRRSCGRCRPCGDALGQTDLLLTRLIDGAGAPSDLDLLADLAELAAGACRCPVGRAGGGPLAGVLREFHDEFQAHLERRCPAGVCRTGGSGGGGRAC